MALPASDSFTRANENPITTNWTTGEWIAAGNQLQLLSNAVRSSSTGDAMAYWDADAFNANHWSECKLTSASPDGGPAVRVTSSSCYYWTPFSDGEVWRFISGTGWDKIGEANFTVNATDVVRLEATGTGATVTIKVYKNGSLQATLTDSTADRILSGSAGLYSVGDTTLDDWQGDNVSGSSPSGSPSSSPSNTPSSSPSNTPSGSPSEGTPSGSPSEGTPSGSPSEGTPSGSPSEGTPSGSPSGSPSEGTPSASPSEGTPSGSPSEGTPSASPSEGTPSASPSEGTPSGSPSEGTPSGSPSGSPSEGTPSGSPSGSPSASPSAGECDLHETFEGVIGSWNLDTDTNGTGAVTRSNEQADAGTYSAKCFTTASGDVAQVREVINSTWAPAAEEWYWQHLRMYIPAATVANLTGNEYMDIAGFYPSAGGSYGWWLRIMEGGAMYVHGYEAAAGGSSVFNIYGTIPTGQWFDLEIGLHSKDEVGIGRSFAVLINGAFYGWYRRGNEEATFNRIAAGILGTNSADDLTVYVDTWYLYGTTEDPCGTDNRPTTDTYTKDYTDPDGENLEIHWYTWINDVRLDANGIWSHDNRLQGGINHGLMPSLVEGWSEIEIQWVGGATPTWPPAARYFAPLISFRKNIGLEENLEIGIYYDAGNCLLTYDAWVNYAENDFHTWQMPEEGVGKYYPGDGDRMRVRWDETGGTNLRVRVDYYDATTSTWTYDVIDSTDDLSNIDGINFFDGTHTDSAITIDSTEYAISYQKLGINDFPSPSGSPSNTPSASPSEGTPSGSPSEGTPSGSPSNTPSGSPSEGTPSGSPSEGTPSASPSEGTPSGSPSEGTPSGSPSEGTPSGSPSEGTPSGSPSEGTPSASPSEGTPSGSPSEGTPSGSPSEGTPSASPSEGTPSGSPSEGTPSGSPSEGTPSGSPSEGTPSASPSEGTPSASPSEGTPSGSPSEGTPSGSPSEGTPSGSPCGSPSEGTPSASPSEGTPSGSPSEGTPSASPSEGTPSGSPSEGTPSGSPSEGTPSGSPSEGTSSASPSEGTPSASPSEGTPSESPSASPSEGTPSASPSEGTPSASPSGSPSEGTPSGSPSPSPSASPSEAPGCRPPHYGPQEAPVYKPTTVPWDGVSPPVHPMPISGVIPYDAALDELEGVCPPPHNGPQEAPVKPLIV